jgi:hypothetical protein
MEIPRPISIGYYEIIKKGKKMNKESNRNLKKGFTILSRDFGIQDLTELSTKPNRGISTK